MVFPVIIKYNGLVYSYLGVGYFYKRPSVGVTLILRLMSPETERESNRTMLSFEKVN